MTVHKYTLVLNDYTDLTLPSAAQVLTVREQHNAPQLWALVDPSNPVENRRFRVAGTGHPISEKAEHLDYIGSVHLMGGALVFHVFEVAAK